MPPYPLARGAVATIAILALLLSACSGTDDDPSTEKSGGETTGTGAEAPPLVEPAWTGAPSAAFPGDLAYLGVTATVAGNVRVTQQDDGLSGHDLTTGDPAWELRLPRGVRRVCFVSPQASPDGVVGVMLEGPGKPCTVAGAVDTRTGRLLWQRTIPGRPPYHEGRGVAVGERTLLATLNCSSVRRFDLRTGRPTGTIAPRDRKCANETATDGRVVAVLSDPVTAETPDDNGTGFIPRIDEPAAFELYDADTGRRRWRREIPNGRGAGVAAVLSSDPLVLSVLEGGHLTNRLVGPGGRLGPYLGYEVTEAPAVVGQADGVLVLGYPSDTGAEVLHGYDTSTGAELWQVDLTDGSVAPRTSFGTVPLVDVTPDGVVVATGTSDAEGERSVWLTRFDLRDPAELVTLGRAAGAPVVLDEGYLVTSGVDGNGDRLAGHLVPATGEEGLDGAPAPEEAFEPAWGEDDLRPEDVRRACAEVTPQTLRLLGILRGDLPEPADCGWRERDRPTYLNRSLRVRVAAVTPGTSEDPEATAAESAAASLQDTLETEDVRAREVPDLGEEAHYLSPASSITFGTSGRLLVRWRNVIVDVTAEQEVELEDRRPASVPDHQVDQALLAAAGDVLGALGADVEPPAAPSSGRYSRAADTCRTIAPQVRDLVPGARPVDLTPRVGNDGAMTGCLWEGRGEGAPSFEAMVYAVPGSPVGLSAEENALRFAQAAAAGSVRGVPGLPGRTWVYRYYDRGSDYRASEIVNLRDNLLVSVDYSVPDDAPSRAEIEQVTRRIARALVAASS